MQLEHIDHSKYEKAISFNELLKAAIECSENVFWKSSVINWIFNKEKHCHELSKKLKNDTYRISPYIYFNLVGPKPRLISSTKFTDRVFQRSLCNNGLYDMIAQPLIYDNGACLNNKGLQFVFNRFKHKLQKYLKTNKTGYIVKCDIKKFFDSTPHKHLKQYVKHYIDDDQIYKHVCMIIDSFKDKRSQEEIDNDTFGERGIGLGSQVSQLLMLLYLNDIDHAIYQKFKNSTYVRYMDDMIMICKTKQEAENLLSFISTQLNNKGLELNKKSYIHNIHKQFSFLKVTFKVKCQTFKYHMNRNVISREVNKLQKLFSMADDSFIITICDQFNSWYGSNEYKMSRGQKSYINQKFKNLYLEYGKQKHEDTIKQKI